MNIRHIARIAALALLWVTLATPAPLPAAAGDGISAHFFGTLTGSTSQAPTAADALFAGYVAAATTSIDVALYELDRAGVRDALIAAHQRGVAVRVVGDDEIAASIGDGPFYSALTAAGIPLVTDAPRSSLQHNKFAVFDGTVTWTGSANFSDTAFSRNGENVVVVTSTLIADIYTDEFEEMFGGAFSTAKVDNTADEALVDGRRVEVAFAPSDNVQARLIAALNSADHSIRVAMFSFTSDPLGDALIAAHQRGVSVEVLLNAVASGTASSERDRLCAAGVTVRVEDWNGTLHNKYAIIDAATASDPLVITGSTNWSANAVTSNDENAIIIHDPAIAAAFTADFARLKQPISAAAFVCNEPAEAGALPPRIFLPQLLLPPASADPPAPQPTPTPAPGAPSFDNCQSAPDPATAPEWPVRIVAVDKAAETATLRNVSGANVDLSGWVLCSITGSQRHPGIGGVLAPGETKLFPNTGGAIWNNSSPDPAALYDAAGRAISYLADD
jgi:HKD family nuclease